MGSSNIKYYHVPPTVYSFLWRDIQEPPQKKSSNVAGRHQDLPKPKTFLKCLTPFCLCTPHSKYGPKSWVFQLAVFSFHTFMGISSCCWWSGFDWIYICIYMGSSQQVPVFHQHIWSSIWVNCFTNLNFPELLWIPLLFATFSRKEIGHVMLRWTLIHPVRFWFQEKR